MTLLLLASCGKQYYAEQTVEDFVDANMEQPEKTSMRDFADLGTTRHINDSLIGVMRQRGADHFKKGISYPDVPQGDLYYLRMRYVREGDTLQNTFYLNEELTEVVAFK
jgi:hypothetical protein